MPTPQAKVRALPFHFRDKDPPGNKSRAAADFYFLFCSQEIDDRSRIPAPAICVMDSPRFDEQEAKIVQSNGPRKDANLGLEFRHSAPVDAS